MDSNTVTVGKFRYWQKFISVLIIGLVLMVCAYFIKNDYLFWSSGLTMAFSGWYGILSLFELFEKIDKDKG